ncbi:MAG: class I SAM-dependent methyltransferase [Chloroflexota bacterium]
MNATRADLVWQASNVVSRYLNGVRGALPLAAEQIEMMLTLLATGRPVERFLDLGCGDGVLGAAILERYPQAQGVLADFSAPMLAAGREKLAHLAGQARFVQLDYAVPTWASLAPGPFDAVVSGYSIHHQPDGRKATLYQEIFDLLAPGGWFVNIEHVAPGNELTSELFSEHIINGWYNAQLGGENARTREDLSAAFYRSSDRAANILAPVETQCTWLRQIGYQDVDCYLKIYELAVFAGRRPKP